MSVKDSACYWTVGALVQSAKLLGSCKTFHVICTPLLLKFRFGVASFQTWPKDKIRGDKAPKYKSRESRSSV